MPKPYHVVRRLAFVDWFAGVGGFRRGLELAGAECVEFCEFDKYAYCSYVAMHCMTEKERESLKPLTLKARQKEILNNDIYLHGEWFAKDVRAVAPYDVPDADLWALGFPCQDISIAGKRRGIIAWETRSGLFYEIARLLEGREEKIDPNGFSLKMLKTSLTSTGDWTSSISSIHWTRSGMILNGTCIIPKITESPKTGSACILSDILEQEVEEKYFLSEEQTAKILATLKH